MARKMKDSGVEWIGEIPEEWGVIKHKYVMHKDKSICEHYEGQDIISLTMSGVIVRNLDAGGKMPTTFDGYQYVEPGNLLLCLFDIDVTPRCVGLVKNEGLTSPAYSRFKVHDGYYNAYYDYLLRYIDDKKVFIHLSKNLRSSLTETDFGLLSTIVPKYEEQIKIAEWLDKQCAYIDAVIEKTKASIEEYKKLKQAVITKAVTKGVRGERPMKDSGIDYIGDMPENWEIHSISELFSFLGGYAFQSERFCEKSNNQVIRIGNVKNDKFILDNKCVYIEDDYANEAQKSRLYENDILFTMTGTKGKRDYFYTLLVEKCHLKHCKLYLNQRVGCFRARNELTCMKYYSYLFKVEKIRSFIFLFETGTANQGNLGIETIKRTRLLCPSYDEQEEIANYLDTKCTAIDTLISKKEQFLTELENYKKSLIYEYVTGKKEVY